MTREVEQKRANTVVWQQAMAQEKALPVAWRQGIYTGMIEQLKEEYPELTTLPTSVLLAVMAKESNFNPSVIGRAGEVGLMQVKPSTAKWIMNKVGRESMGSLSDPTKNILTGMSYLSWLTKRLGGIEPALHAYNVGPTAYRRGKRAPKYVRDVISMSM